MIGDTYNPLYGNNMYNGNVYGSMPSMQYLNQLQQNQMQQQLNQIQQQQKPVQNVDWVRINNIDEAQKVTVGAGGQVWIMLNNDSVFGVKSANNLGVCETEWYTFSPLKLDCKKQDSNIDDENFVSVQSFNDLKNQVESLNDKVSSYELLINSYKEKIKSYEDVLANVNSKTTTSSSKNKKDKEVV